MLSCLLSHNCDTLLRSVSFVARSLQLRALSRMTQHDAFYTQPLLIVARARHVIMAPTTTSTPVMDHGACMLVVGEARFGQEGRRYGLGPVLRCSRASTQQGLDLVQIALPREFMLKSRRAALPPSSQCG